MRDGQPWYIPAMSDDRKTPLWPWIAALLIGLPVLYVLSSGPARSLLMRKASIVPGTIVLPDGRLGRVGPGEITLYGQWINAYGPLDWASQGKCGALLRWYWQRFPIPEKR